ncbi:MAG: Ig-like domain-containing protein, partial [Muribaculum sp.]|nr:Ig-like domain-containing protein [Muribaculum sp.]
MRIPHHKLHYLLGAAAGMLLAACASIGRPNGGAYDYDPPVLVKSTPSIGGRNFTGNKVVLEFDENVQLQDISTKVVVSPAQKLNPSITANGHKVTVELRDTMLPNTTYTIDFSDAIKDLNEGNVIDGVAVDFSTGADIDSLKISGMVFEARTLEPAQGMLVGVYSNMSDTALTKLPMERIAKTNQYGQFTIRGLKPGNYRLYAINDVNRDYHWDRSEDIAFYDVLVSPQVADTVVTDSLLNVAGEDSLVTRRVVQYLPNDVLLTWFNENYIAQYIKDYQRQSRHKVSLVMGAPSDSLPIIRPVGGTLDGRPDSTWAILNRNAAADSLEYFITDSALIS